MDDYLISTLLLLALMLIVVAYLLNCFDLALKMQEEPTTDNLKEQSNQRKLQFLHRHREVIKAAITQYNAIIVTMIGYIVLYLVMRQGDMLFIHISIQYIISIIITAILAVLFIHLLPSVTYSKTCDSVSGGLYYFIIPIVFILYPTSKFTLWMRNKSYKGQLDSSEKPISMEELSDAVEIVSKVNTMEEKRILSGMVRFANADVEDIMCHRTDMVAIDMSADFSDVKALFVESGFSRIPVYRGNNDNIEGIIHLKDVLPHIEKTEFDWHSIIHKPLFAENDKPVNELLLIFQSKKEHIAIVVDEYGSTLGLVTLEDVLEEIVGEINDEFDEEDENYCLQQKDGTYIIEGKAHVSDLVDMLNLGEDTLEEMPDEIDTVAGLIVELLQDFPKVGASVVFNDVYRLTVISMSRHRIDKIKIEKIGDNKN